MNRRHRTGYALVELLVVMTVMAVLLTLAAGMIHLLMKLDRSGRAAFDESADLIRLSRDFRADAHASKPNPVQVADERLLLTLEGGRTVEYLARPREILRTLHEGEKVRSYETYRRPARSTVKFRIDGTSPTPFLSLTIDRPADSRDPTIDRDHRIEAELGKDLRINPRAE
jgi:prepilin-type N-terminal cleavage/methylation domain-containing protein